MDRVFLDDARWFDRGAAQRYGHRPGHCIYRTRKGTWIVASGVGDDDAHYRVLQERQAFAWLMRNGYVDNVPAQFVEANEI